MTKKLRKKRMLRKFFICSTIIIAASIMASAQAAYSPEKGSPERKAILDALRIPVEKSLKQKIVFTTDNFKVLGTWAFVSGTPTTPAGGRPDLKSTAWKDDEDMFDDNFFGLLRKTGGRWKVVTHALGCTDVCYADWWRTFKAPKAIFPYAE